METSRRELLTGLAAVAAAGVVPVLLDSAAVVIAPLTPREIILDGFWHLDMPAAGRVYLRHVNSGLAFAFADELDADDIPKPRYIGTADKANASAHSLAFERAAKVIAYEASIMRLSRQHSGAIYVRYFNHKRPHKFDPITTDDAPPWSRAVEQLQLCPWCHQSTPVLPELFPS